MCYIPPDLARRSGLTDDEFRQMLDQRLNGSELRVTAVIDRLGDEPLVVYAEDLDRETAEWLHELARPNPSRED